MSENKGSGLAWLSLFLTVLAGLIIGFFHNLYTVERYQPVRFNLLSASDNSLLPADMAAKERFVKPGLDTMLVWVSKTASIPFNMERPQALRLKISAYFRDSGEAFISVNGRDVKSLSAGGSGGIERFEVNVPGSFFNKGRNQLDIKAGGGGIAGFESINVKSYIGISGNFPKAYVLFDENAADAVAGLFGKPFDYLFYPAFMFILWITAANLICVRNGIGISKAYLLSFYWYLPSITIAALSFSYSYLTPYSLIYEGEGFDYFVFLPIVMVSLYQASFLLYDFLLKKLAPGFSVMFWCELLLNAIRTMAERNGGASVSKGPARRFLNTAGSFAIIGFSGFLFTAGVLLIFKRQELAERMADIAYFALVFGVLTRVFDLKEED